MAWRGLHTSNQKSSSGFSKKQHTSRSSWPRPSSVQNLVKIRN